jgi:hypothetical protein
MTFDVTSVDGCYNLPKRICPLLNLISQLVRDIITDSLDRQMCLSVITLVLLHSQGGSNTLDTVLRKCAAC